MIRALAILLGLFPHDYRGRAGADAAYVCATRVEAKPAAVCCGRCKRGTITQGDGHVTDCPCDPSCQCKVARELPASAAPPVTVIPAAPKSPARMAPSSHPLPPGAVIVSERVISPAPQCNGEQCQLPK